MPWPCYMVEQLDALTFRLAQDRLDYPGGPRSVGSVIQMHELQPGAMWWDDDELVVWMPSLSGWNIDRGRKMNAHFGSRKVPEWTRTGDAPNVTVTPSINHVGRYHGWLRDGVLTDDCEGRNFPPFVMK